MSRGKAGSAGEGDRPREFGVLGAGLALDICEKKTVKHSKTLPELEIIRAESVTNLG